MSTNNRLCQAESLKEEAQTSNLTNEPMLLKAETPVKDIISILGVQGLMYNSYNVPQHKVLMTIIKHAQQVIKGYVVPRQVTHGQIHMDPSQIAAGYVDVDFPLKEFGYPSSNYPWLRGLLEKMGGDNLPINIPYKMGDITYYKSFDRLFKPDFYKTPNGTWHVKLRFTTETMQFFYAFDKGVTSIDLNVLNRFKNVSTRKFYILIHCWVNHGFSTITPQHLIRLLCGKDAYRYYGDLENKQLLIAKDEMKALYDKGLIDSYFTYLPHYSDNIKHAMPDHISITKHDRKYVEPTEDMLNEQEYWRRQLKIKLIHSYDVDGNTAMDLSAHMRTDYVGELHDWFLRKDFYIEKQLHKNKPMNKGGYIVAGLKGFFKDKEEVA